MIISENKTVRIIISLLAVTIIVLAVIFGLRLLKRGDKTVNLIMAEMTLADKIGQMFMIGFDGTSGNEATVLIRDLKIGGVILYSRNIEDAEQVLSLTDRLQTAALTDGSRLHLLIATDQEGGRVTRLPESICDTTRSNGDLGESNDVVGVESQAFETARAFTELGINMNLAPMLDVRTSARETPIGSRSYGYDREIVTSLGLAYIQALQDSGIIATAKHFPGHGATDTDSHNELPVVTLSRVDAQEVHFYPFKSAVESGVDAIMTAHVAYQNFSDSPATLSEELLRVELRENMGFEGVIVSDDMLMGAIRNELEVEQAVVDAVAAGVNILIISDDGDVQKRAWLSLYQAVVRREIDIALIDDTVERIISMKLKYGLVEPLDGF